ncbi:8-amino-7-oxononanoate synthase [Bacillus velezensis]|uniref:8-amino-7-oxononanoate synthase n=1 Tax=Bacillus velezensis TaxID=492670 RepID=UPI0021F42735|nr:8-amino-7-oxononanoate synthase [Bacillus velezensis]UYP24611.1 8-amino-7-oxononanoate synthase [Bacillus velezensis]
MDFDGWLLGRLDAVKRDGLYRTLRTQETALKTKGQKRQTWASNDYLGLSKDERLITAAQTALSRFGAGSGGSRLTTGNTVWHEKLEQTIADFKQTEAALLFSSGYLANIGVLASLPQKGDVILSDQLNHASIVDGCRLSKAETIVYRHIDMADLEKKLASVQTRNRRFIVTDGVFSMDGTIAPLDRIMALANQYQAFVIADDAHATGVLGENGGGTSDYFGVCPDVVIGTLSKAVGTEGGFAAGSNIFIDFLLNQARTFVFQTALPPSICAASHTALDLISDMHDTRRELQSSVKKIKTRLADMGFIVRGGDTPIIPVIIGDAKTTVSAAALLEKKGICAPAIRPPAVPEGESRIRLTVTADRSLQDIDELTEAFDSIRKELNINK